MLEVLLPKKVIRWLTLLVCALHPERGLAWRASPAQGLPCPALPTFGRFVVSANPFRTLPEHMQPDGTRSSTLVVVCLLNLILIRKGPWPTSTP